MGKAGDTLGHHPRVSMGKGYVDLELVSDDAIYRDDEGTEHVVEWVTQQDIDLARRITEIAADHKADADPASVSVIGLALDPDRSFAFYSSGEDDAAWVYPPDVAPIDGLVVDYGGQATDVWPERSRVTVSAARVAARRFVASGGRRPGNLS